MISNGLSGTQADDILSKLKLEIGPKSYMADKWGLPTTDFEEVVLKTLVLIVNASM